MSRAILLMFFLALPLFAQQQNPPADSSPPQAENPQSSGAKKVLRRAAPNCVRILGREDCWSSSEGEKEAQQSQNQQPPAPQGAPPPRSQNPDESSSKDTKIDPAPPGVSVAPSDVQELHPYDPHRAEKDVEVGDFYFKRQNYVAAESRYAEALLWKPNDAIATFRLAAAQEKLGKIADARKNYQNYLDILPKGEFAPLAHKALTRLNLQMESEKTPPISPPSQTRQ